MTTLPVHVNTLRLEFFEDRTNVREWTVKGLPQLASYREHLVDRTVQIQFHGEERVFTDGDAFIEECVKRGWVIP